MRGTGNKGERENITKNNIFLRRVFTTSQRSSTFDKSSIRIFSSTVNKIELLTFVSWTQPDCPARDHGALGMLGTCKPPSGAHASPVLGTCGPPWRATYALRNQGRTNVFKLFFKRFYNFEWKPKPLNLLKCKSEVFCYFFVYFFVRRAMLVHTKRCELTFLFTCCSQTLGPYHSDS